MQVENILGNFPDDSTDEVFESILKSSALKLERIISNGQATPEGVWYDQENNEWVLLIKGSAGLRFWGKDEIVELKPGDFINIPAHVKHRVEFTDKLKTTIWLALHYSAD